MKNKIIWLVLVVIILVAAGIAVNKYIGPASQPTSVPSEEDLLQMSPVSVFESNDFFKIEAEYPQFKGVDSSFNEKISLLINQKIADFKKDSTDNWEARKATTTPDNPVPDKPEIPFSFQASWAHTQLNSEYLSFTVNIYYFTGGAHGSEEIYAFNYDVVNKKEITINDFFGSSENALEKLSELSEKSVTAELQSKEVEINDFIEGMIKQGTAPFPENFKDFNFSYNSLIVYFQRYQVAPGAAGSITITFYKDTLEENSLSSSYLK